MDVRSAGQLGHARSTMGERIFLIAAITFGIVVPLVFIVACWSS